MISLPGVEKVEIDFAKKSAVVTMKADMALTEDSIRKALKDKGYGLDTFKATGTPAAEPKKPVDPPPPAVKVYRLTVSGMT